MNDSPVNFSTYCNSSKSFIESISIKISLVFQILFGLASVFGNGLLMVAVWRVSLFHTNLRWLLINLSLNLFWYAGATVLKALHFLSVIFMGNPCLLVISSIICKYFELTFVTPFLNSIYSIMAVGIERLYCTMMYRTYDKSSKIPWIACLFIPAIWIGTIGNQVAIIMAMPDQPIPICLSFIFTPLIALKTAILTNTSLEFVGLIIIWILYFWNLYKRDRVVNVTYLKRGYSLASRFQIIQNVNVNKLLLPSVIAHACAHLPYCIFQIILLLGVSVSTESKVIFFHCSYVWFVFYGTVHAWLAFSRHPQLRAKFESWVPEVLAKRSKRKVESYNLSATTDAHFDMLCKQWAIKGMGVQNQGV